MPQSAIQWTSLRGPIGPVVGRVNQQGFMFGANPAGRTWFVDTVNGNDSNSGLTPTAAFATMGRAFFTDSALTVPNLKSGDQIYFVGKVREQLVAPLLGTDGVALTGVKIIGLSQGNVRDDDGSKWTYPASGATAGKALLALRQQGWAVANFLMTPEPTSGAAIKLNRAEDATNPDASHFIADNMKFVGIDVTTTYGIQDVGGVHNLIIQDCQFLLLTTAIYSSSQSIATPLRWLVQRNRFFENTNDIDVPSSYCEYQDNRFFTPFDTGRKILDIASGGNNVVIGNAFPNAAADIDPAHGYDGNATDVWTGNYATDAVVFGDPA